MTTRPRDEPPYGPPRSWSEAPVLAEWVLAPLAGDGVTVCEHLTTTDGTIGTLSAPAAYLPQVDARVLCRPCAARALGVQADAMEAGLLYPSCAICREPYRPVTQWQTPRGAPFLTMAWICDGCATAGSV